MMNKVIVGSLLAAVMGGTPTVTYFLTQEKENVAGNPTKGVPQSKPNCQPAQEECQEVSSRNPACPSDRAADNCPASGEKH